MRLVTVPAAREAAFALSLPAGVRWHASNESRVEGSRLLLSDEVGKDDLVLIPEGDPMLRLRTIVDLLRSPHGCPWDREQTHTSLRKPLLEEAYEFIDAVDADDDPAMREELGDLLLQPILHAAIAKQRGAFDLDDAATAIADKLERRHPHVFGETEVTGTEDVLKNWDAIKRTEGKASALGGVPRAMPALDRAMTISRRAARVGFEWPDHAGVFAKLDEEVAEVREAFASGDQGRIESEIGDLLFTVVNLARWSKIEPEEALNGMLDRFSARFERMAAEDETALTELSPDEWEARWSRAKAVESGPA